MFRWQYYPRNLNILCKSYQIFPGPFFFFFAEMENLILKLIWNSRGPWLSTSNCEKEKPVKGLTFPSFYKAAVVKATWCWHQHRLVDPWARIRSLEINSGIYSPLIFHKGAKNTQWGKNSHFAKWGWDSSLSMNRQQNWTLPHARYKVHSKWIHDLHIKAKIIRRKHKSSSSWPRI